MRLPSLREISDCGFLGSRHLKSRTLWLGATRTMPGASPQPEGSGSWWPARHTPSHSSVWEGLLAGPGFPGGWIPLSLLGVVRASQADEKTWPSV